MSIPIAPAKPVVPGADLRAKIAALVQQYADEQLGASRSFRANPWCRYRAR